MNTEEQNELNAWIAEHVMGWKKVHRGGKQAFADFHPEDIMWMGTDGELESSEQAFRPTTDPAAAFEVLKKCAERLASEDREETVSVAFDPPYFIVEKTNAEPKESLPGSAPTLELAVCQFGKKLFSK